MSFSVVASSLTSMSYKWYRDGALVTGATNSTYTISNAQSAQAGVYRVDVINLVGTTPSSNATLTVLAPPSITTQPVSQTVAVGQNISFSVVVSGSLPMNYQWRYNGVDLSGATNSTLARSNVQLADTGGYDVVVNNLYGSATSSMASLTVLAGWFRVVVNTNDSGAGSLRQALLDASVSVAPAPRTIAFNITNASTGGPYTISPLSALPSLATNLVIDGYTQPGASENTLTDGNNAVIKIRLWGASSGANGLDIGVTGCAVYGLAIVNFPGHGLYLRSSGNATIQGNFIGLDPDGITLRANTGLGIRASSGQAVIGGSLPWQRNVISGNLGGGISMQNSPVNIIQGNFIGTDASGTRPRGNRGFALELTNPNSFFNVIGGSQPGEGNVISAASGTGTTNHGISIFNAGYNLIQGNYIGTDVTGTNALGNLGCGIYMTNTPVGNLIGGTNSGAGNVIAYNAQPGVWIADGTNNGVLGNAIYSNGRQGIDLGVAGVLANDAGDADSGPNQLQNYPVLTSAVIVSSVLRITGSLDSRVGSTYRLEFFSSPGPAAATNNQGRHFIGATDMTLSTTPGNFKASVPWIFTNDTVVTATATDPVNNTSEFSASRAIVDSAMWITNQPQSQKVAGGRTASFSVGAGGMGPFTYQWIFNGTALAGATNSVLTLDNVQAANAGDYTAVVSNPWISVTSAVAVLTFNFPPVSTNDLYIVAEDQLLTVSPADGILSNDVDPNGDALTALLVSTTTRGTLALNADGSFSYLPATNYNGSDSFTYRASDGPNTGNVATVTFSITPVYDPAVAINDTHNTLEDTSVTISVLTNDYNPDGALLTITSLSTTNGTATLSSGTNIVFTPSTNFYGLAVFSYTISDGTSFSTANVTVTVTPVNDAPLAVNDSTNTLEDTRVTIQVLANDSDVEGGPLAITGAVTTNGTAVISGGNIIFTPATNFNGTVVFSYTISDGTNSATANVTVIVNPVYDAPIAYNDSVTIAEDTSVTISVLTNDYNPDGALLTITSLSTTNGTATLSSGTNIVFRPSTNFYGLAVFSYTISDGTSFSTANVSVTVTPVNDAPVAVNDSANTLEDTGVTINVLANDSDVEGSPLTITTTSTTNGTAVVSGTNVVFTPATNFNGTVVFSYTMSDGTNSATANVTVIVTPVNDAPLAVNDSTNTLEDTSVTIQVLANDSDAEGSPLTITTTSTTNGTTVVSGTNVVFTPATNFNGTVVFSYTISDGTNSATANVTVIVNPVYDAPIAYNDSVTIAEDTSVTIKVLTNDYNPDRALLTITNLSTTNGTATLSSGTNIVFRPSTNFYGLAVFSYTISDGTSFATANVTVTVTPVNDAPLASDDTYTTLEDVPLLIPPGGILTNDFDVEGSALSASLIRDVSHGTLTLNPNGSFTYTPDSNYFGSDSFTYYASDGVAISPPATVTINTLLTTPLRIVSASMATNGFKLKLVGPAPAVYTVLTSTNNQDWAPVSSLVALTGTAEYIDTGATNQSVCFYKAAVGAQATTILEQNTLGGLKVDTRLSKPVAQSFTRGTAGDPDFTISKVVLYLSREPIAPSANVSFSIGTGVNAGTVAGSIVAINPLNITNLTSGTSFQYYEIAFGSPVGPLTAGTTYYLNLENEAPNDKRIYFDRAAGAYPNGTFYRDGINQNVDVRFEVWGQ